MTDDQFKQLVTDKIKSGSSILWLYSPGDEERAQFLLNQIANNLTKLNSNQTYELYTWDWVSGSSWDPTEASKDPKNALLSIETQTESLFLFKDLAGLLNVSNNTPSVILRRVLIDLCQSGGLNSSTNGNVIIVISDNPVPHPDLKDYVDLVDMPMPGVVHMEAILAEIIEAWSMTSKQKLEIEKEIKEKIVQALLGLTSAEAVRILAYASRVASGFNDKTIEVISEEKIKFVRKIEGLTFIPNSQIMSEEDIGGYAAFKDFIAKRAKAYTKHAQSVGLERPRGVAIIGPPGCLHGDTPIFDPVVGDTVCVRERYDTGKPFHVIAYDVKTGEPIITEANRPHRYPKTKMVKVMFKDGQSITVTPEHKLLTEDGFKPITSFYEAFGHPDGYVSYRLPSISEPYRLACVSDAHRLCQTLQDYPGSCPTNYHLCDAQPLADLDSDLISAPLLDDARRLCCVVCEKDVPGNIDINNLYIQLSHQPRLGFRNPRQIYKTLVLLHWLLLKRYECAAHYFLRFLLSLLVFFRLNTNQSQIAYAHQSTCVDRPETNRGVFVDVHPRKIEKFRTFSRFATDSNLVDTVQKTRSDKTCNSSNTRGTDKHLLNYNQIIKIEQVEPAEYYDFHVPYYNNYWACGVFHHNTGKTMVAKAAARMLGLDLIIVDMNSFLDSYVGNSEKKQRAALATIAAMPNALATFDELDKMFSSTQNGTNDSGVTSHLLSTFLAWLNDRDMSDPDSNRVFVAVTANRINNLPPELLRAGRFDRIFGVDLPNESERADILAIHLRKRNIDPAGYDLELVATQTAEFSGAELEELVITARHEAYNNAVEDCDNIEELTAADVAPDMDDLITAAISIKPLAVLDRESVNEIRNFCAERTYMVGGDEEPPIKNNKRRLIAD